jgi:hypothetical protein
MPASRPPRWRAGWASARSASAPSCRGLCQKEDADLKRLETLVRRILFLVAMETPLPEFRQAPPRDLSGKRPPAAPPVQIVFPCRPSG